MRRAVVVLSLLALALPMAAWADSTFTVINKGGNFTISDINGGMGTLGVSTLSTVGQGSPMTGYGSFTGTDLGKVSFTTGTLTSGSIYTGGVFSSAGSSFQITAGGTWSKGLNPPAGPGTVLFSGAFTGNVTWTLDSVSGTTRMYTLSGTIIGQTYSGVTVSGTVTENFTVLNGTLIHAGGGTITMGTTTLPVVPEPGTLALLGTGLVGIAGMFRRRLNRS